MEINMGSKGKALVLWGFLVILLFSSLFHVHTVVTSPDSAWYMSNALNIYNGRGYVDTDQTTKIINRGPLFPMMIAASYALFDVSVNSALLVVRLFFILNVLIIFLLAKELFDYKVAFVASLLYLFSSTIHQWSAYVLLDNTWPFFILLGLWLHLKAFKHDDKMLFSLSGLSIAAAYLIKEVSLLILLLPILYWVLFFRKSYRKKIPGLLIFYISFFVLFFIWGMYTYSYANNFNFLFGVFQKGTINTVEYDISGTGMIKFINKNFLGIGIFYKHYLTNIFIILSYCITLGQALFLKSKPNGFLILTLLCFYPLASYVGLMELRIGQVLIIYFLTFIAMSNFLFFVFDLVTQKIIPRFCSKQKETVKKRIVNSFFVVILIFLLLYHVFGNGKSGRTIRAIFTNKHKYLGFLDFGSLKVKGWHNDLHYSVGEWIKNNIPEGSSFLCERYGMRSIYFFTGGKYKMFSIPYRFSDASFTGGLDEQRYGSYLNYYKKEPGKILFLFKKFPRVKPRRGAYMIALSEDDLLIRLKRERIEYVIITAKRNFLTLYFDNNPCFEKLVEFKGEKIKIYKVNCIQKSKDNIMRVSSNVSSHLEMYKNERPLQYRFLIDDFLGSQLGLSKKKIDNILQNKYPLFEAIRIYPGTKNPK